MCVHMYLHTGRLHILMVQKMNNEKKKSRFSATQFCFNLFYHSFIYPFFLLFFVFLLCMSFSLPHILSYRAESKYIKWNTELGFLPSLFSFMFIWNGSLVDFTTNFIFFFLFLRMCFFILIEIGTGTFSCSHEWIMPCCHREQNIEL